jgi:hypothetical protein
VEETPRELRRQAEHCRDLACGHFDRRVRLILTTMADEFDQQARDTEAKAPRLQNGK